MANDRVILLEAVSTCDIPTPDTMFVYNARVPRADGSPLGIWAKWTGPEAFKMLSLDAVNRGNELLYGDGSGLVKQLLSGGSDNGTDIDGQWRTPWLDGGEPDTVKTWREVHLFADQLGPPVITAWEVDGGAASGEFSATYKASQTWGGTSIWNNAAGTVVGGLFWAGPSAANALIYSLPQAAVGRRIRFTFSDDSSATPFRLNGYGVYFRTKRQLHKR